MTDERAREILANPSRWTDDLVQEAHSILEAPLTLDDMYGCDPWDDDNYGRHPASR